MTGSLATWISDADALRHLNRFGVPEIPLRFGYHRARSQDYYLALVGELFDLMREGTNGAPDWARLGNAIAQFAATDRAEEITSNGVDVSEATLFAAAAFYFGGYPASAYLTIRSRVPIDGDPVSFTCYELLARPTEVRSETIQNLIGALEDGDLGKIAEAEERAAVYASEALRTGPNEWIPARLLHCLLTRFRTTNIRAVLPDGSSEFWTPLVKSWLNRRPPAWDFFPSQIEAIERGLLQRPETFSLQMPTGAGKTAICETLLYWHLKRTSADVAILLVPFRSLASELRGSLVKRLNEMGISAGCAYGGTVPSGNEVRGLDAMSALVATPETLSGLLSANPEFSRRISLVVCDEGHLLDGPSRGISLELLLARLKTREAGSPRFVFVSAIVPNIEEINSWLGGSADSVVRSEYRPALAEFAVLRQGVPARSNSIGMEIHPHEPEPTRFMIEGFLRSADFQWINPVTGRRNTFPFGSVKARSVAAARKSLPRGAAVVFAANKRGKQGAVGLADELLKQLQQPLPLPEPLAFANRDVVKVAAEYLDLEYGREWVGTKALRLGAVLHHGDIPQETREVVEGLLRGRTVRLGICTSTLAEGVNLPIRTLVLYSVQRRGRGGRPENLLTRDIKNLVGRAGRAGETTKGLVICANEQQWHLVEPVAKQAAGEPVVGALRRLIQDVGYALATTHLTLTNQVLEDTPVLYTLIDGIDATLIDLAAVEIGEDELLRLARRIASETFASKQMNEESRMLLQNVFELRAGRVTAIKAAGRLDWLRETGTRARMLDTAETGLLPRRLTWDDITNPIDAGVVNIVLEWAWTQRDLQVAARSAYRIGDGVDITTIREPFFEAVRHWLAGSSFVEISAHSQLGIDDTLGLHAAVITYVLQTIIEQGITLLSKLLESQGRQLSPAITELPEHLRFGVPTRAAHALAAGGVRHRRAAVALGSEPELSGFFASERLQVFSAAQRLFQQDLQGWIGRLGTLVANNTLHDLSAITGIR